MQAFHTHLRLETDLQYKHIKEQHVNKTFDNIKQTQGPVLNQNTDSTTAAVTVVLVAHFNLELESLNSFSCFIQRQLCYTEENLQ